MDEQLKSAYEKKILSKINKKQNMTSEEILHEITSIDLKPSLLIMSGGLDTTTLLYLLVEKGIPLMVLSFDYGQMAVKEIELAKTHCEKFRIEQKVVKISESYIDGNLGKDGDIYHFDSVLIPNRNSVFLSIGVSYALQHGFERVYYGATKSSPDYADCQPRYVHQFNILNMVSDLREVQIRAPFIDMDKTEIIDLAIDLGVDLTKTWSCYNNTEKPCGVCDACILRKEDEREYLQELNKKTRAVQSSLNNYEK